MVSRKKYLKKWRYFIKHYYSWRDVTDVDLNTVAPNMPKLSEEDSALLEGPILYAEAVAAPRHMNNNTSPGPDGFTEEFFMFFSFLILVLFWCVQ